MKSRFPINRLSRAAQAFWGFLTLAMAVCLSMTLQSLPPQRQAEGARRF